MAATVNMQSLGEMADAENISPNVAKRAPSKPMVLEINMTSGKNIASIRALESWTAVDLIKTLKDKLESETEVAALLHKTQVLEPDKTLSQSGVADGAVLQVVIAGTPTLHLFHPRSSEQFGRDWLIVGSRESMAKPGVQHDSMDSAPLEAKKIAMAIQSAFPDMGRARVCCDNDPPRRVNVGGRLIVISNPGSEAKEACMRALALRRDAFGYLDKPLPTYAVLQERDWKTHVRCGFNGEPDDEQSEEEAEADEEEAEEEEAGSNVEGADGQVEVDKPEEQAQDHGEDSVADAEVGDHEGDLENKCQPNEKEHHDEGEEWQEEGDAEEEEDEGAQHDDDSQSMPLSDDEGSVDNYDSDRTAMSDDDEEQGSNKFAAVAKIMAKSLTNGFYFSFEGEYINSPVIYGGFTSDGSIVGIVSLCVRESGVC